MGKFNGSIKYLSKCTVYGHGYTAAIRNYEQLIARAYQAQGGKYYDGDAIRLCVRAICDVPKSASEAERLRMLSGLVNPLTGSDTKVVMDALRGVAYKDDKQVKEWCTCRAYGEEEKLIVKVMVI